MRIISKFHDYYDSIQGYGFDPTIIYIRNRDEIHKHDLSKSIPSLLLNDLYSNEYKHSFGDIGEIYFCGKRYRFVNFIKSVNEKTIFLYFYSLESLLYYLAKAYKKDIKKRSKKAMQKYIKTYEKECKEFYSINNNFEQNIKLHEQFNTPIFTVYNKNDNPDIVINPSLKDMNFQKVFDPYRAFQEIDMFLSGVLQSPENKMIDINDSDMRDKKGFNDMSFKKEKWKHI